MSVGDLAFYYTLYLWYNQCSIIILREGDREDEGQTMELSKNAHMHTLYVILQWSTEILF